jgi:hypothetical protein
MYLAISKKPRKRDRTRGSRKRAKIAAKDRRRVNRSARRRISAAGSPHKH